MEFKPIYKNEVRLNKPQDINRVLARVTNALIQGEIDESLAKTITYVTQTMIQAQRLGDIETRLEQLEDELDKGR